MGANAQTSVPAFTAGQVLTAAQMTQVNTGIPVFASSTERDAAFGGAGEKTLAEGQMAYLEDTNATQYYDGSAWTAIAGGKILQVVSTTKTDTFSASVASGAFAAITGMSAAITPSATANNVLVTTHLHISQTFLFGVGSYRLMRGATPIGVGDLSGSRGQQTAALNNQQGNDNDITNISMTFLDSPSTTSSTTYSVEFYNYEASTRTLYLNRTPADDNLPQGIRPISTITLMEVSA